MRATLDVRGLKRASRRSRAWSGLSSNDGIGLVRKRSNPVPARSDSPDLVDGSPDGADIAPDADPGKPEAPHLRSINAGGAVRFPRNGGVSTAR